MGMHGDLYLSTDLIEPALRNDYWREITRPFFETLLQANDSEVLLEGSVSSRFIGKLTAGRSTFNTQHYRRDRRIIRQGGLDHSYLIQLRLTGTTEADCEGRSISIAPGDVTLFDLDRGWTSIASSGATLSIVLPREPIDKVASGRSLHSTVFKAASPVTRVLADFITSLYGLPTNVDSADTSAIDEAAIAFFASVLEQRALNEVPEDPVFSQILRRRVTEFIEANLTRPDLGPVLLMHRFRISRAHLYRIFAPAGGVATVVRDKRLDAAYQKLTRLSGVESSITEIAYELGFSSSNQFLRAFRARFGITPSDARQEGALSGPADQQTVRIRAHFAKYASPLGAGPASAFG